MDEIDRVLKAKVQLQKKKPFFGFILLRVQHSYNDKVPTARINIKGEMQVNKEWISKMSDDEVEGVVEHEALHLIFEHLKRRIKYVNKNKKFNERIWCICEDLVVNDVLVSNNQPLPEGVIPTSDHSYTLLPFDIKIEDIDKKTVEEIFDEIMSKMPKGDVILVGGGQPQQGDSEQDDDQQGNGMSGSGGEDNEDDDDGTDGDGRLTLHDEQLPKPMDEIDRDDDITDEEEEKELKKWRKVFMEAVTIARNKGNMPDGVERRCEELFKEKINWRGVISRFVAKMIPFDYSFNLPAKKSYALGVYLPSTDAEKIEIILSLDTSGSIDQTTLTEFLTEMCGIARQFYSVDMKIIVCDADIHDEPLDLKNVTPDQILEYVKLKGGGGTSHKPVFRWIKENCHNARLLIAFTDGKTDFPDEEDVTVQTIWVLSGNHIREDKVPFGQAIVIPKYEKNGVMKK